jgi:hypothetical protein
MASDFNGTPAGGGFGASGQAVPLAPSAQTTNTIGGILGGNPVLDPGAVLIGTGKLAPIFVVSPCLTGAIGGGLGVQAR